MNEKIEQLYNCLDIALFQTKEHQEKLCMNGALAALAPLLTSTVYKVRY